MKMAAVNQPGYDRRLLVVESIVKQFGLESKSIETLAYYGDCSFPFNNFIYKIELKTPAGRGSFSVVVRLSNLRAEGLNNANRVANDVASSFIASQAIENAGLEQIVPVVYAWAPPKSIDVIEEENFGWVVCEYKKGQDLDGQLPLLSGEEKKNVLEHIAKIVAALQNAPVPATVDQFGGLTFDDQGNIVSAQMVLVKDGPFGLYANVWEAKLQAQLDESQTSAVLNGWREEDVVERIRNFISAHGVCNALEGVALRERKFVHGDLTTNNMVFDTASKKITGLLDFDWSAITHPAEEFISGFRDIGGCVDDEPKGVLAAILANDFSAEPENLPEMEAKQWDMARAWAAAAARNGVKLPGDTAGMDKIKALHDFSSAICPMELSCEPMLRRLSDDAKAKKKKESLDLIISFLEKHKY
ncbi:hypothetical protein LMH87_010234 [Akanthomyces muscarius]|uniref:non-specific serine/threonine protein kinase n=1 Tax=Akanthomyces muscarius TaxID=2231603 RepID=A0A9W8UMR0_AKAMU|nr:hypothetical protein LMH87_010234 [Akanthomyces muscarius]KAJ4153760.1 hypothetical protein LMH87_010234 [Akanthomyces muscarius]